MPRLNLDVRRTNPLVWVGAIICTIIAIAVIVTGLVVFMAYTILHPRVPFINVVDGHLDKLDYNQFGQMDTQITLIIKAENQNARAHATFADMHLLLYFDDIQIAVLATAEPFDVLKNSSVYLQYVIPSSSIPLEENARSIVDISLKRDKISFALKGNVKTRWKVAIVGTVKFWSHLSCNLQFFRSNGSSIKHQCSSRSH